MSAALEPAWVLSQRPYGNSGRLLELFAMHQGRLGAVARGVHRKAHGGQPAQLLQPFQPLLVAFSGRGELRTLSKLEAAGRAYRLPGQRTLCGLYLNELLLRVLARFDPYPTLFARYGETMSQLESADVEPALRRFEVDLLDAMGYRLTWSEDASGSAIDPSAQYAYVPERGFVWLSASTPRSDAMMGHQLLAIADSVHTERAVLDNETWNAMKRVNRLALAPLLGDKPLQTRAMAQALDWSAGA